MAVGKLVCNKTSLIQDRLQFVGMQPRPRACSWKVTMTVCAVVVVTVIIVIFIVFIIFIILIAVIVTVVVVTVVIVVVIVVMVGVGVVTVVVVIVAVTVVVVVIWAAEGGSGVVLHLLLQSVDLPLQKLFQRAGVRGGRRVPGLLRGEKQDRKSTRLNSSH